MKLDELFERVAPYLEGHAGHEATVGALWGASGDGAAGGIDAARLAIYADFCALHRLEAVSLYKETARTVERLAGEGAWERLAHAFVDAHPMRHFELNANGAALGAWLVGGAARPDFVAALPAWVGELADLEWAEFVAEYGADAPQAEPDPSASSSAIRLAPTVDLRRYAHDLVGWLDAEPRPEAPRAVETLVLVWRDADLDGRRDRVSPRELAVLKMASEGLTVAELSSRTGLADEDIEETVDDLALAGVLLQG